MENFIVSARKYRPMDFKSVIGQQSITTTLKSSIKNNHLAHAYLFTGPRGVGKTTCARIFSKTINCNNRTSEFEACNECESCKSFNENRSYNIHELDAASNNSVEDIRSLIEQVRIPPQIGTHSVYIIDEVHMLSTQAFNAFLKTLEEPPEYAIFVLATTEKHKIIPTILSRCQIFDFNRIKVEDSVKYLTYVAGKEGIEAETDALNIISQKADGAMRDALSFFDQIVSFAGNKITYQDAIDNLNVLDYDYYFKLTDYFLKNEYTNTLLTFNEILDNGFDGNHFITGLSSHFRDLLVCKNPETVELIEVGENIKQKYLLQSAKCSVDFLLRAMDVSNNCDLSYRDSKNKRLLVELSMLKICNISKAIEKKANSAEIARTVEQKSNVAEKSVANSVVKNVVSEEKQVSKPAEVKTEKTLGSGISLKKPIVPANENAEKSKLSENTTNTGVATQEEMIKAWEIMLESIKSTPRMYNTLKGKNPVTEGNNLFTVDVNGQLLLDALETRKGKLVESLRNILKKNIELKFVLSDEIPESLSKQPYTDKEKYNHLKDKNENLEKFRDTFGLDF